MQGILLNKLGGTGRSGSTVTGFPTDAGEEVTRGRLRRELWEDVPKKWTKRRHEHE